MRKLALVRWRDAYFEFDRSADVTEREDYLVETVGWVDEDADGHFLSIVGEKLPEDDGERAVTNVPKDNVIRVVPLTATAQQGPVPDWFTQEY